MANISPFPALRYASGPLEPLVCPPYDIISPQEEEALLRRHPHNIIRLEKPRDYAEAADTLRQWLDRRVLQLDDAPSYYLYQEEFTVNGRKMSVSGLMADLKLEPFSAGVVLPHEETLAKARGDRHALLSACRCNFSPIYCLYIDKERAAASILDQIKATRPDLEITTDDGIVHRLWRASRAETASALSAAFAPKTVYIADGHHRYNTALQFHQEQNLPETSRVMALLCDMDDPGLVIWPTHRVLAGLPDFSLDKAMKALEKNFSIEAAGEEALGAIDRKHTVGLYAEGRAYLLTLRNQAAPAEAMPDKSKAYQSLDVALLHSLILKPVFGIDTAQPEAQAYLTYTRSAQEALDSVANGAQCAFFLGATTMAQLAAVSAAGERMPQKSTYFYPKLITGLVMKMLRPEDQR